MKENLQAIFGLLIPLAWLGALGWGIWSAIDQNWWFEWMVSLRGGLYTSVYLMTVFFPLIPLFPVTILIFWLLKDGKKPEAEKAADEA